jgi:hypothetical protein
LKLLWVKANKPGSQVIRWGLDSDCSHFAICFDEGDGLDGIVFHSYGKGTQLEWMKDFLKKYEIVHALEYRQAMDLETEEAAYKAILDEEANRDYDYPAMGWWAWRALLKKIFNIPISKTNNWQSARKRLCTGIFPAVCKALKVTLTQFDAEMVKPHEMYDLALETGWFIVCDEWRRKANLV